jgi:hypothetical protein
MTLEQKKIEFLEEYKQIVEKHNLYISKLNNFDDIDEAHSKRDLKGEIEFLDLIIHDLKTLKQ